MSKSTMRAFVLAGHGGLDQLQFHSDWAKPEAGEGEVVIRVGACGLNNTDINTRTGWYSKGVSGATTGGALSDANSDDATWGGNPIQLPRIQGADVCGIVEEAGKGAPQSLIGKRVMIDTWLRDWDDPHNKNKTGYFGSECDGGYAEYTKAHAKQVHAVESDMSDAEIATFATSYTTAENMLNRASVSSGDAVLITGASGGVGSALIQLCRRRNAKTIAMCGESKADAVRSVGADFILPRAPGDLKSALRDATGSDSVDVVADIVGGTLWEQLIESLCRGGRYVCSGAIAGPVVNFDLRTFYLNDLSFFGGTVVPPGLFATLVEYIERKEIRPLLAASYPLEKLHDAQQAFIDKQYTGNIVVCP